MSLRDASLEMLRALEYGWGGMPLRPQELEARRALRAALAEPVPFDILAHLQRQRDFCERTFGPGARVAGLTDHITKELVEIRESGGALAEWIDVIILAFDGALRSGASPRMVIDALVAKQDTNERRKWPDWRTVPAGKAIEHDRTEEGK